MAISDLSVVFLWRMDIHAEMVVSRFNTIKPSDTERTPLRLPSNDERALMMSSLVRRRSGNGAVTIDISRGYDPRRPLSWLLSASGICDSHQDLDDCFGSGARLSYSTKPSIGIRGGELWSISCNQLTAPTLRRRLSWPRLRSFSFV